MHTNHLSLISSDVPATASFFRDVLDVPVRVEADGRTEVELGAFTASVLAETAIDPKPEAGVILQLEVPDVTAAADELRRRGATVLMESVLTEWGTRSAFVAGPDDVIVELYRVLD